MSSFTRAAAMLAALIMLALSQVATAQGDTLPTVLVVDLNVQVPGIQVGDVLVVGPSEATAQATIDTNGLATNVFVEYGTNGVLNQRTPVITLAAGLDLENILVKLLGLQPSIISYRIVAENSAGRRPLRRPPSARRPQAQEAGQQLGIVHDRRPR